MSNWGTRIKDLRKEAGLTQVELAKRSGLKRPHISRIECGALQGYKQEVLKSLAKGLDMTTSQLAEHIYGGDGDKEKKSINHLIQELKNNIKCLEQYKKDSEK